MPRPKGQTLTRQQIVDAAIACLASEGIAALGVNRVARELGIQPPSMYNHISGNDALRQAVAIAGLRRLLTHIQSLDDRTRTASQVLRSAAEDFRRFVRENTALYVVMSTTKLDQSDPNALQVMQDWLSFYDRCFERMGLTNDDSIHASRMFTAALQGFIQIELGGQFARWHSLDDSYAWMVDQLIASLESKSHE